MSTEPRTHVTDDGRKIRRVLDELRELETELKEIQDECARKRESGRIKDHKKERARTDWIAEERKTIKLRKDVLESVAAYAAGAKLDELESEL